MKKIRIFWLWLPMIVLAFANATLRELVFMKYFPELRAHQYSTVTLIFLCAIYIGIIFPYLEIKFISQAFFTGICWVLLTVAFEFILGRITNKSWDYLFRDYHLSTGHIWPVFLLCLFLLPVGIYQFRRD